MSYPGSRTTSPVGFESFGSSSSDNVVLKKNQFSSSKRPRSSTAADPGAGSFSLGNEEGKMNMIYRNGSLDADFMKQMMGGLPASFERPNSQESSAADADPMQQMMKMMKLSMKHGR